MCRWVFYYGDEVCISKIIYGAYHGLANMADGAGFTPGVERDIRRNHEVNVHGCGIGWYGSCPLQGLKDNKGLCSYSRPCCYTTIAAPSHDRNLRSLSKAISTSLLFGHVRAAGPGASVHEYNCHPFYNGRYMFMHNGEIHGFKKIRRSLLATLRDDLFEHISGTTDSEVLFALVLNQLPDTSSSQSHEMMENAVREAMCLIMRASGGKSSSMNLAFTDGETVVAARYRNSSHEDPPSLYFHLGPLPGEKAWDLGGDGGKDSSGKKAKKQARGLGGFDKMMLHGEEGSENRGVPKYKSRRSPEFMQIFKKRMFATQSMLVSSEPLSMNGLERWQLMPPNSLVVTHPMIPTKGRCSRKEFLDAQNTAHASVDGINAATVAGRMSPKLGAASPVLYCEFKCLENLERIALNGEDPSAATTSQQSNSPQHVNPHGVVASFGEVSLPPLKSALSSELLHQNTVSSEPVSPAKVYKVNERDSVSGIAHALEKQGLQYSDSESDSLYSRDDATDDVNRSPTPKSKLHKVRSNERNVVNINSPNNKNNRVSIDSADCIPRPQRERHHRVPQYGLVSLDEEGRDLNRRNTDTPSPPIHYGGDGVIITNDSQTTASKNLGDFYSPTKKNTTNNLPVGGGGDGAGITMSAQPKQSATAKTGFDLLKQTKRGESSSYSPEVGSYFGMLK